MKIHNVLELIGQTPHLRLHKLFPEHEVWIKLEQQNPAASIKDRISLGMIEDAESSGKLKPGGTIIEATSGNTGIGLSLIGAVKGYRVIIVMTESQSIERQKIVKAYGAELVLTAKEEGIKGALSKARELQQEIPGSVMLEQFSNPANRLSHQGTAQEIIDDFKQLDYLVTAFGTGGHLSEISQRLKHQYAELQTIAVDPKNGPTLSPSDEDSHNIPGIGPGFIPDNLFVNTIDHVIEVSDADAFDMTRRVAQEEGLFVGVSTGAVLSAIDTMIHQQKLKQKEVVLTFSYDTGERYLSIDNLFS